MMMMMMMEHMLTSTVPPYIVVSCGGVLMSSYYPYLLLSSSSLVCHYAIPGPSSQQAVDEGYTYFIDTSPDVVLCLLQGSSSIDSMDLKVGSKGYTDWRVSG